jgi:hypothetical protein
MFLDRLTFVCKAAEIALALDSHPETRPDEADSI